MLVWKHPVSSKNRQDDLAVVTERSRQAENQILLVRPLFTWVMPAWLMSIGPRQRSISRHFVDFPMDLTQKLHPMTRHAIR